MKGKCTREANLPERRHHNYNYSTNLYSTT